MTQDYKYLNFPSKLIRVALVTFMISGLSLPTKIVFASNLVNYSFMKLEQIQELIARQVNGWETANTDQIIADFAEDSLFIVPGTRYQGKKAIQQVVVSHFADYTNIKITVKRIIFDGRDGAVEWDWQEENKATGELIFAEDAIVFAVENGKIKYWREYIEPKSAS
ncbi:MAG: nuclear transport factor 2 family protein [Oscillatoria sp. PMC 1068.18]|nr:nuclear transport factor 2 family protein [Oscillatoria sp. PMC 1076.18]MEC4990974.1 nuclear transport factor 2 family protein [Oscillatoria sp. PMC 1068.18]